MHGGGEVGPQFARGGSGQIENENLAVSGAQRERLGDTGPPGDLGAVWRELGAPAVVGDLALAAAHGGNHVEAAAIARRAKNDPGSVGGEVWFGVVARVVSKAQGLAAGHLFDPDIEVTFAAAIGSIGQQGAVGRDGGVDVETGIVGQANGLGGRLFRGGEDVAAAHGQED